MNCNLWSKVGSVSSSQTHAFVCDRNSFSDELLIRYLWKRWMDQTDLQTAFSLQAANGRFQGAGEESRRA